MDNVGFPGGPSCKGPACQCRRCKRCRFNPWDKTIPWGRAWQPTPVFLPGESHRQAGYSPWGHKESDASEHSVVEKNASPSLLCSFFCFSKHLISENLPSAHSFVFTAIYLLKSSFSQSLSTPNNFLEDDLFFQVYLWNRIPFELTHVWLPAPVPTSFIVLEALEILNMKDVLNVTPSVLCHANLLQTVSFLSNKFLS